MINETGEPAAPTSWSRPQVRGRLICRLRSRFRFGQSHRLIRCYRAQSGREHDCRQRKCGGEVPEYIERVGSGARDHHVGAVQGALAVGDALLTSRCKAAQPRRIVIITQIQQVIAIIVVSQDGIGRWLKAGTHPNLMDISVAIAIGVAGGK